VNLNLDQLMIFCLVSHDQMSNKHDHLWLFSLLLRICVSALMYLFLLLHVHRLSENDVNTGCFSHNYDCVHNWNA